MSKKNRAVIENKKLYDYYLLKLTNKAIACYDWKNLPQTIDVRYLEHTLFVYGKALVFNEPNIGLVVAKVSAGGPLDIYNVPTDRRAYASNGMTAGCNETNSVLIYNTPMRNPSLFIAELYAQRLAEIDRTIDVNVKRQKTPFILTTNETQQLTVRNLMLQIDDNQYDIIVDKNFDNDMLKSIDITAPYVADKLQLLKEKTYREAINSLGINATNTEKKERMITSEVEGDNGDVENERFVGLMMRRQAVDKINEMFGTNIEVDFRTNQFTIDTNDYDNATFNEMRKIVNGVNEGGN